MYSRAVPEHDRVEIKSGDSDPDFPGLNLGPVTAVSHFIYASLSS